MLRRVRNLSLAANAVVVIVVREVDGKYETLLVRRAKEPLKDRWLYVTGAIEGDETAAETAIRELREETGLTADRLFSANIVEPFYATDIDTVCLFPVFVAFVSPDAKVLLDDEAEGFQWLSFDAAIEAVPTTNPRLILRRTHQDFLAHQLDPWFELDPRTGKPKR